MQNTKQTMKEKQQERNYKTLIKNNPEHRQVLNTSCYMTLNKQIKQVFTDSFLAVELVEKDYNQYIPNVEETSFTYPDMSRILDTTYHTFTDKIEVNNTTLVKNLKTALKGGKKYVEFNAPNLTKDHYNIEKNNNLYKTYIDIKKFIQAIEFITPDKDYHISSTIDQKGFIHIVNNNGSKSMLLCCNLPLINQYDKDKEECYFESEENYINKFKKEIITYDSLMSDNLQTLIHIKNIEKIINKQWNFTDIVLYADKHLLKYIQQQIGDIITLYLKLDNIKEYVFTCEIEHKNNSVLTHFKARLEE